MRENLEQEGNRLIQQMSPFLNASGLLLLADLVSQFTNQACDLAERGCYTKLREIIADVERRF